jgi:hypothetical protein
MKLGKTSEKFNGSPMYKIAGDLSRETGFAGEWNQAISGEWILANPPDARWRVTVSQITNGPVSVCIAHRLKMVLLYVQRTGHIYDKQGGFDERQLTGEFVISRMNVDTINRALGLPPRLTQG